MNIKKRYDHIDALKGFAILLVVFGHAIQSNVTFFDENIFFRIIYSFHMALFMFLSGMVASYSFDMPVWPYIKKKFMVLVVPFIAWYAVAYFANGSYQTMELKSYIVRILLSPDWGLWFLWVLFLNFCFLVLAVKMEKGLGLFAYPFTILFVEFLPFGSLGLGLAKVHFVYFTLGYLVMKHQDYLKRYLIPAQVVSLILFPVLVSQWHRTRGFLFIPRFEEWIISHGIPNIGQLFAHGLTILLALSGIAISFVFIVSIKRLFAYKYLCKLGNYTLDIYVSHQYFFYGIGFGIVRIFSSAGMAFVVSLLISALILRRVEILNILFLGGRIRVKNKINYNITEETVTA